MYSNNKMNERADSAEEQMQLYGDITWPLKKKKGIWLLGYEHN